MSCIGAQDFLPDFEPASSCVSLASIYPRYQPIASAMHKAKKWIADARVRALWRDDSDCIPRLYTTKAQCIQRKTELNWTQLNWTELGGSVRLSLVQFSFSLCFEPATTGDGRRRFLIVNNQRRPSPVVADRRRFSSNDRRCIDWPIHESMPQLWRTCDDRQFRRRTVPDRRRCRRRFNAQRETELNLTKQFSSAEFGSVQFSVLHRALYTMLYLYRPRCRHWTFFSVNIVRVLSRISHREECQQNQWSHTAKSNCD